MSPLLIKIRCRMRSDHLGFCASAVDQTLYPVTHRRNHVAECFQLSSAHHFSSCRNDVLLWICPVQLAQQTGKCSTLGRVNQRIAVSGKYLTEIKRISTVKVRQRIRIAVPRLLMHDVNRVTIQVKRDYFGKSDAWPVDSRFGEAGHASRRAHRIAAQSAQRILVHRHKGTQLSPSSIAL